MFYGMYEVFHNLKTVMANSVNKSVQLSNLTFNTANIQECTFLLLLLSTLVQNEDLPTHFKQPCWIRNKK